MAIHELTLDKLQHFAASPPERPSATPEARNEAARPQPRQRDCHGHANRPGADPYGHGTYEIRPKWVLKEEREQALDRPARGICDGQQAYAPCVSTWATEYGGWPARW